MLTLLTLFLASGACIALMLLVELPDNSLLWSSLQNVGHFLIFAFLTLIYLIQLRKTRSGMRPISLAIAAVLLLVIAALIELVQSTMPGRDASMDDMVLDTLGIICGYLFFCLIFYYRRTPGWLTASIAACAIAITAYALKPALQLIGYHLLKTGSPAIVSFADPFVESTISVTGSATVKLVSSKQEKDAIPIRRLRMDLANEIYSGVVFHDTARAWRDDGFFSIQLLNTDEVDRTLQLRIHDIHHNNEYTDRFNTTLIVKPGTNKYSIPVEKIKLSYNGEHTRRQLDMGNISEIQLFSSDREPFSLLLTGLYLSS